MVDDIEDGAVFVGMTALHPPRLSIPQGGFRLDAGFPSPATDYREDALDLNEYLIRHKAASFIFQVKGQSMRDAGILEGDRVIVDRAITPQHGQIVNAVVNGNFTIKRLYWRNGTVELHPENPEYQPISFGSMDELEIWGVVTGAFRRYI